MTVRAREYVKTRVYEDMDKRIKILTIGSAMYDIFLHYICTDLLTIRSTPQPEQFILMQAGKKHELQDVMYHTGGGATNSAVSFARLGLEVSSFLRLVPILQAKRLPMNWRIIMYVSIMYSQQTPFTPAHHSFFLIRQEITLH